eukprot:2681011-Karenia_brevis.AAC.1
MLWSVESTTLCAVQLRALNAAFSNQVFKMWGKRHHEKLGISFSNWIAVQRRHCSAVISNSTGDIATQALKKFWPYAGHIARKGGPILRLIEYRGQEFVELQRSRSYRDREAICSWGGHHRGEWDFLLHKYACTIGDPWT